MNITSFALEMSPEEAESLSSLLQESGNDPGPAYESRAFDGETIVNLLIPVVPAVLVVVRTWLVARAERGRAMSVSVNGRRLTVAGYTPREVIKILDAIENHDLRSLDASVAEQEAADRASREEQA